MPLNRATVKEYVLKHWNTPCDDGILHSNIKGTVSVETERKKLERQGKLPGTGWRAVMLPEVTAGGSLVPGKERGVFLRSNPAGQKIVGGRVPPDLDGRFDIVPFYEVAGERDGLVDCAHYVSRVYTAGGVAMNHPGVPGLVQAVRARADTRTLGLEVPLAAGDRIMNTGVMQFGDLIAYFHADRSGHRGYAHSAVYTGRDSRDNATHRISCHTVARFDGFFDGATWNIDPRPEWRFTLVHFTDEAFPPIPQPLRLTVTRGGRGEVYDFKPGGKIARGPATARTFGTRPEDNGYWFTRGFTVFVFWPRTGEVAKIVFGDLSQGKVVSMTVDDVPVSFTMS